MKPTLNDLMLYDILTCANGNRYVIVYSDDKKKKCAISFAGLYTEGFQDDLTFLGKTTGKVKPSHEVIQIDRFEELPDVNRLSESIKFMLNGYADPAYNLVTIWTKEDPAVTAAREEAERLRQQAEEADARLARLLAR